MSQIIALKANSNIQNLKSLPIKIKKSKNSILAAAAPTLKSFCAPRPRPAPGSSPRAPYLCHRAGHPSWSHRGTARARYRCHGRTPGEGCTCHSTGPASHTGTWGQTAHPALVLGTSGSTTPLKHKDKKSRAFPVLFHFWGQSS